MKGIRQSAHNLIPEIQLRIKRLFFIHLFKKNLGMFILLRIKKDQTQTKSKINIINPIITSPSLTHCTIILIQELSQAGEIIMHKKLKILTGSIH